mgnify:CR=1 FL=1
MPRMRSPHPRLADLMPDPVYRSVVVTRSSSTRSCKRGKRSIAEKIV